MASPVSSRGRKVLDQRLACTCGRAVTTGALRACSATLVPPLGEVLLDHEAEPRQADTEQTDDQDGGEHAGGVEILRGAHDELAEAGRRQEELRGDHADQRA